MRPATSAAETRTDSSFSSEEPGQDGWYLFGITRPDPDERAPASIDAPQLDVRDARLDLGPEHGPVFLVERGSLAAVVRRVSLADYTAEALQARLGDPALLRLAVQTHNDVICAVHRQWPVLPARFGAVYAQLDDVAAAIDERSHALLAKLAWLDGCDEWAVHVHVDRRSVRAAVAADQALEAAQRQLASASPGRAYFLRRKLDEDLAAKTAQVADEIALAAYQRLARVAVDAVAERPASSSGAADETEVLQAALLVRRERRDELVGDLRAAAEAGRAWHCTYSGPWPPYSFAALPEQDGR